MTLPGPSRRIRVEPIRDVPPAPKSPPSPERERPAPPPERAPRREREKVPA